MKRAIARATVVIGFFAAVYVVAAQKDTAPPAEKPIKVADGVWFQQHNDIGAYGSNVGWIEFADFVVVIDSAFPRGAEAALKNIKATTRGKRVRYVIVTHYHGDHSFGAGVFAKDGAIIVGHENARREFLARNIDGYRKRVGVEKDTVAAKYRPHAPDITFTDKMVIDDGRQRRAELYFFGHAHTTGCIFTFLPKEKLVFTGDAAVNGNFNYMGDANTQSWIDVLTQVQSLGAEVVVPGHGPVGKSEILASQKAYFVELRAQVAARIKEGKTLADIQRLVDIPAWKMWTGESQMKPDAIEHVYQELTRGTPWQADAAAATGGAVAYKMAPGQKPTLKFLTGPLGPDEAAGWKQVAPNVEVVIARNAKEAMAAAPDVHGAAANFATPEFLRSAEKLTWLQVGSAGVEQMVSIPELVANDQIVLTNMKRVFGPPIADHAFAMLLSLMRSLPVYADNMRTAAWSKQGAKDPPLLELRDKTMLVIGLGGIGTEVARRAHAFGMRVIATDPKAMAVPAFVARLDTPDKLPVLLPVADVVVLAMPLTGHTKGLIGAAQFGLMKPTAFFINVARGKEYDNLALAAALKAGRLAGAGLDVTDPEPLPPDHPLWKAPRVIITPHVAGRSPGTDTRRRALMMENMRRFGAGEPLLNVVDKKAGY